MPEIIGSAHSSKYTLGRRDNCAACWRAAASFNIVGIFIAVWLVSYVASIAKTKSKCRMCKRFHDLRRLSKDIDLVGIGWVDRAG
jgi:hypothetical protein